MIIENDLLKATNEEEINHIDINKNSGIFEKLPIYIVAHYTASGTLQQALNTFVDPDIKASCHLIIDRDGAVVQLDDFSCIMWHAGKSKWKGKSNLNYYSIGIELVNWGYLRKSTTKPVYYTWTNNELIDTQVLNDNGTYWEEYTTIQIGKFIDVCQLLKRKYNINDLLGHNQISPKRKVDPGPAFPLNRIRTLLFEDRK